MTQALIKGIHLNDALFDAIANGNHDNLRNCVHQHRSEYFDWTKRRSSFLKNLKELEEKKIDSLRGKEHTLAASRKKSKVKIKGPDLSTEQGVRDFITTGFKTASKNGQSLALRYLNQLEYAGKIPNPHLLPYTPETLQTSGDGYDSHHVIKGSTQKVIDRSFDTEYIESTIIPSLVFDLNNMTVEKLTTIVNEKGPYQAVAKETKSGIIAMPYLLSPFKHKPGRRKLASLIRKQVLWFRIKKVWETAHKLEEENMNRDGSYPIRGSCGFGPEELMKPRLYYERLIQGEEMFQLFCEIEQRKLDGRDPNEVLDLDQFSWTNDLDTVSDLIRAKYNSILQESNLNLSDLQRNLQLRFDEGFEAKVKNFSNLVHELKAHGVCKHSEIVTPTNPNTLRNDLPNLSYETFPTEERVGRGKTLGDFLKSNNFPHFEFGNELRKKLNEIMTRIVHKF
ncbi:hypothetical protein CANMA_002333 [Candida margitis]|uniref:uncharacterized protein n=1 Tax=Candida margitis TaxID=1775924 RepID=UPI002226BA84|nr:uncharacterized protein CANMA_002333 [Candida margitis]KAI5968588.1 hypothetical protein CANMA_002333 [Candida margitis]